MTPGPRLSLFFAGLLAVASLAVPLAQGNSQVPEPAAMLSRQAWAVSLDPGFNLYRMTPSLFRSALPDARDLPHLQRLGVRTVVSFIKEDDAEWLGDAQVRRVSIPKPAGGERHLGVPAICDRVVQASAKLILEPIYESDFLDCSYGFRPGRSAHDALDEIRVGFNRGRVFVVDADIARRFDSIRPDVR